MEVLRLGSSGPFVDLLQSTLLHLGFYSGTVDGNFGKQTEQAVKKFQRNFGLTSDGIVGTNTWNALYPYLNGYTNYTIKNGDTIYSIASKFSTSVNRILAANPTIDIYRLSIGSNIIVPFGNIVPTNVRYTSQLLDMNVSAMQTVYPFLETGIIGYSQLGDEIPYIRLGVGTNEVFYNASFHANEWITTVLLMKFIEDYSLAYVEDFELYGYNIRELFNSTSIYLVPLVNPDGVNLVNGFFPFSSPTYQSAQTIANNYPDIPFPTGWKANISGIDLNLQFPAGWENAKEIKFAQGYTSPAPRDYVGIGPLTAPEAIVVYNFTRQHNFRLVIAYHTQGEVIFWQFQNYTPEESLFIGEQFSDASGYALEDTPYNSSFAGYKDWFIQDYRRPGYTIEAGYRRKPTPYFSV